MHMLWKSDEFSGNMLNASLFLSDYLRACKCVSARIADYVLRTVNLFVIW